MLEECQCLAYGAVVFLSKQYSMLCWIQEVTIRSVSLGVVGIYLRLTELFEWSDLHSSILYENQLGIDWTCCWFQQYSIGDRLEYVPEVWRHMMWNWWDGTRLLHRENSQLWVMEWYWQPSRFVGSEQVRMMSWIWIIIPGRPKNRVKWKWNVVRASCSFTFHLVDSRL